MFHCGHDFSIPQINVVRRYNDSELFSWTEKLLSWRVMKWIFSFFHFKSVRMSLFWIPCLKNWASLRKELFNLPVAKHRLFILPNWNVMGSQLPKQLTLLCVLERWYDLWSYGLSRGLGFYFNSLSSVHAMSSQLVNAAPKVSCWKQPETPAKLCMEDTDIRKWQDTWDLEVGYVVQLRVS